MKKALSIIIVLILLLVSGVRIAFINLSVQEKIAKEEYFTFGKVVSLGNNYFFSEHETIDGYTIQVKESTIITMDEFLSQYNQTTQILQDNDISDQFTHIYLVVVRFENVTNEQYGEQGVDLFSYKLVGPDYYLQVFDELLEVANPILQAYTKFTMEKGNSIDIVLPFTIDARSELATSINYIQKTHPKLLVSQYPVKLFLEITP